jgi:hypothetical protein
MGDDKMIYERIKKIIEFYINDEMTVEKAESFCNQIDVIFSNFSVELEKEVNVDKYELIDDLNMICDSYEKNEEIRKMDSYCIDEKQLYEKTSEIYRKL